MGRKKDTIDVGEILSNLDSKYDEKTVNEFRDNLKQYFGEENYKKAFRDTFTRRHPGVLKIFLLRKTIGWMIIRSNEPDSATTMQIDKKEVVVIPARKLKSKEKITGLTFCRKFKVIHPDVKYNLIKDTTHLANPNSVIFGDSVTQSGISVGLPAKVYYDWACSIRSKELITETLTHNQLSELGTMWDPEKGETSSNLFDVEYIVPGVIFPHFLTLYDVTPESFVHVLLSILNTTKYGAQTTTLGDNMINEVIFLAVSDTEAPVTSYLISKHFDNVTNEVDPKGIIDAVKDKLEKYSTVIDAEETKKIVNYIKGLNNDTLKHIYTKLFRDCVKYILDCNIAKPKDINNYVDEYIKGFKYEGW